MERQGSYTHGHHPSVLASHGWRTAENSAAYLLPHLAEGNDVLDVGCGPGTITVGLAQRVHPGRVVGLDPAGEALMRAAELAEAADVENVLFEQGDVHSLRYADDAFAVVHDPQLLQQQRDPAQPPLELPRACRTARAHGAGFQDVTSSAGVWCYSGPEDREWWSRPWATRVQESSLAGHLLEAELATPEDLSELAQAWQDWGRHEDGWFAVVHGEILIR